MTETVDLTPTPEGYANIARRFAAQIIEDLPRKRSADDRQILDSFVEIVAWLASTGRGDLIARIRDDVAPTRREHKPAARARYRCPEYAKDPTIQHLTDCLACLPED